MEKNKQKEEGIIIFEVPLMKTLNGNHGPLPCDMSKQSSGDNFHGSDQIFNLNNSFNFFSLNCDVKDQM